MLHFILLMSMCLLYIFNSIVPSYILALTFKIVTIVVFIYAFYKLPRNKKLFTGLLFFIGIIIHMFYGQSGFNVFGGIEQNLPLLAIILLAPLLSIPLKGERLLQNITTKLEKY